MCPYGTLIHSSSSVCGTDNAVMMSDKSSDPSKQRPQQLHVFTHWIMGNYCLLRLKDKAERLRRANNSYKFYQIVMLDVSNCTTGQEEPFSCLSSLTGMKTHLAFIRAKTETRSERSRTTGTWRFWALKWHLCAWKLTTSPLKISTSHEHNNTNSLTSVN